MTKTPKKLPIYIETEVEDASRDACSGCKLEQFGGACRHQPMKIYTKEGSKFSTDEIDLLIVGDTPSFLDNKAKQYMGDEGGRSFLRKVKSLGFDNFAVIPAVRCYTGGDVDHFTLTKKYKGAFGFKKEKPLDRANEAVANCKEYTQTAVREYNPKLTLAMGPLALKALDMTGGVPSNRHTPLHRKRGMGKRTQREGVVVTHDRFGVAMNDWAYREMVKDINKLRTLRDTGFADVYGDESTIVVNVLDSVEAVRAFVDKLLSTKYDDQEVVCFDFETENLDVSKESNRILNVGFTLSTEPDISYVVPLSHPETPFSSDDLDIVYKLLRKLFRSKGASFYAWLGHNIPFEISMIKLFFGVWLGEEGGVKTLDTMTLLFALEEDRRSKGINKPYSLESAAQEFLDFRWYKESKIKLARNRLIDEPLDRVNHYVGVDSSVTARFFNRLIEQAIAEGSAKDILRLCVKLYGPANHYIVDLKLTGLYLDLPLLQMLRAPDSVVSQRIKQIEAEFAEAPEVAEAMALLETKSGAKHGLKALFKSKTAQRFNPHSDEHRKMLFHNVLGLDGADVSVDKVFQDRHKNVPLVKLFAEWSSMDKLESSYLQPLAEALQHANSRDGRVRATFNLINTKTGRLSANDPPVQTVPRSDSEVKKQIKAIFSSPPGKLLVQLDFSQAEVRWLAIMSGDKALAEKYRRADEIAEALLLDPKNEQLKRAKKIDGDLHMSTAIMMYKLDPELVITDEKAAKKFRQRAKSVCFGLIYGKNYKSLAKDLGISEDEALEAVELWLGQFPQAAQWLEDTEKFAAEHGYVRSPFGRWRRLPEVFSSDMSIVNRALRQSRNTPVQSAASDTCIYAACKLRDALRFSDDPGLRQVKLVNTVHDSLIAEVPADKNVIRAYAKLARSIFMDPNLLKKDFGIDITVPLTVDFDVGVNWGNMSEYDFTEDSLDAAFYNAELLRLQPPGVLLEHLEKKGLLYKKKAA